MHTEGVRFICQCALGAITTQTCSSLQPCQRTLQIRRKGKEALPVTHCLCVPHIPSVSSATEGDAVSTDPVHKRAQCTVISFLLRFHLYIQTPSIIQRSHLLKLLRGENTKHAKTEPPKTFHHVASNTSEHVLAWLGTTTMSSFGTKQTPKNAHTKTTAIAMIFS